VASTYYPRQAIEYAKTYIKSMPLETVQVRILDDVNKYIWMAAPFRWTLGNINPITLVSNTQDYTQTTPYNFISLVNCYITDGAGVVTHLRTMPSLPPNVGINGNPRFISYEGSNTYRISPNPGVLPVSPVKQIMTWYKKASPIIKNSNLGTAGALIFDDEYFPVYVAGVLWMSYLYADDQRAGTTTFDSQGKAQYTGQRAVFEDMLQGMINHEPIPVWVADASQDQLDTRGMGN